MLAVLFTLAGIEESQSQAPAAQHVGKGDLLCVTYRCSVCAVDTTKWWNLKNDASHPAIFMYARLAQLYSLASLFVRLFAVGLVAKWSLCKKTLEKSFWRC